jgi:tetratricopeptide (TPR) repeat protein
LKRSLRKQIKQDELVSSWEQFQTWAGTHQNEVRLWVVGIVLVAVVGGGFWYFRTQRLAESRIALDQALRDFDAPIATADGGQDQAAQPASSEEKYRKALAKFDGIARRYGSSNEGRQARYYAALCRVELGETEQAESELRALAQASGGAAGELMSELARLALAETLRSQGQPGEAVTEYEKALAVSSPPIPRDHVLFEMAGALEEAGQLEQAAQVYRRVVDEHPDSRYAQGARTRAEYLSLGAKG